MHNPGSIYLQLKTETTQKLKLLQKRMTFVSIARLVSFVAIILSPYLFLDKSTPLLIITATIGLSCFFLLVKYHQKLALKRDYLKAIIKINSNELEAIEHNFSIFDSGEEFINPNHFNSYDLDLFGRGSLFQFLNRTITNEGKKELAKQLQEPILEPEKILSRQELIKEISQELEWRQDFSATSQTNIKAKDEKFLLALADELKIKAKTVNRLKWIVPSLILMGIGSIVVSFLINNSTFFLINLIIQAMLWMFHKEEVKEVSMQFGKQVNLLQKYKSLLQQIETFEWKSEEGKELVKKLKQNNSAKESIEKLVRLVGQFDNRNNLLLGFILNLVFAWDLYYTIKFYNWQKQHGKQIESWIQIIAFIDATNSFSNYYFNHPQFTFPKPIEGKFDIEAENLGHVLIKPEKCIRNDFKIIQQPSISIITGANMSGKSTFLRTIGVNLILAMAGAPIMAAKMRFTPIQVFSNMRTTDSLFDDESYFFAELKRLQQILEYKAKGHNVLIILDEILKGTNSKDKLYGSQQFIKQLIEKEGNVIIATHDLKLTELEAEYPKAICNYCFEIDIENEQMHFDYKLRKGITEVMNATFLMKKMGIIDN